MVLSRRMFNWGQLPKHVPRRKPERVLSVPLSSHHPPARCHTRRPCQETVRCHNTRLLVTALSVSRAVLATNTSFLNIYILFYSHRGRSARVGLVPPLELTPHVRL